jgi:hypothetical protein
MYRRLDVRKKHHGRGRDRTRYLSSPYAVRSFRNSPKTGTGGAHFLNTTVNFMMFVAVG